MEMFVTRIRTNLNGVLEMTQMFEGLMMTGDNLANQIIVELNRDGTPVPITSNYSIVGYIIRNDGETLEFPGEIIENGHASIVLPPRAYDVVGPLSIAVRMISGDSKVVIATASCYINETNTNAVIDPYHVIPDIQDVIDKLTELDEMETQISDAEEIRAQNELDRIEAEEDREDAQAARNQMIDGMTVEAVEQALYTQPTVVISEVSGHKHLRFGFAPGDPFVIARIFASVAEMEAYTGTDIRPGQFVIINTNNVQDPDNAKMYLKTANGYSFVTDLSGATGIRGPQGETGNGISSTVLNQDYTLTINFTDGTAYTTPNPIRGLQGETGATGATGNGISSVVLNQDYTLTINFTDGTSYTTPDPIRGLQGETGPTGPQGPIGPQGIQGSTGNGISSIVLQNDYTLLITFTDGTTYTTPNPIRGPQGETGATGATGNGIASVVQNADYTITINFTDQTSYTTPEPIRGQQGEPGINGVNMTFDGTSHELTIDLT